MFNMLHNDSDDDRCEGDQGFDFLRPSDMA